ncbi:MAG: alkaline phosphatase PhoX [Myxococcota bacterium]
MPLLRRDFLRSAAILTASTATLTLARQAHGEARFGALEEDPEGVLDLPAGFTYTVLQTAGDTMSDDEGVPALPDGMACFEDEDGNWVLMRNHELSGGDNPLTDVAYDAKALGGVSRLVLNPADASVISSNLVLTGTLRNCAGGPSEWGWLSCEETDFEDAEHGWVFLCRTDATGVQAPDRIDAYGRFKHEAVALDPRTRIAYLTEDEGDGAFYRFVPERKREPFVGQLQAMAIVGSDVFDTSTDLSVGDTFEVRWVDVADSAAAKEPTAAQAQANGAAIVKRGEGIWFDEVERAVFFTATSGGPIASGQIFRLDPTDDGGTLTLVAQAEEGEGLLFPDNLTVAPWGDLIVCEDNLLGDNHLRGVCPDGRVYPFARNRLAGGFSEFAGACFSPDGRVLFVNIQAPGLTIAIEGPFPEARRRGC